MSLRDVEGFLYGLAILISPVHLPTERGRKYLNLFTGPPYKTYQGRNVAVVSARLLISEALRSHSPDAIRLSLNAAMYQSQVFLMSVNVTIANSEMYIPTSPSNLICLARLRTSVPRPLKKVPRARSA